MRVASGDTARVLYFVAVDATDLKTRETGLTTFTVYRSRDGGTSTAMTTPTVAEVDATNMPGVYTLLLDEDTTIGAGNDFEEMLFHITQAAMTPVDRTIDLYRPKITEGNTLGVAADGDVSGDVDGSVIGSVASVTGSVASVTGAVGSVTGAVASVTGAVGSVTAAIVLPTIPANWITAAGINASAFDDKGNWNIDKTGYALTQAFPTNFADLAITITTGKITVGTNDDKTGYALSQAFPTNFADLAIEATNGRIDVGKWVGTVVTLSGGLPDINVASTDDIALSATQKSDVNAEVLDVMNVDTFGEPGQGAPGETVPIFEKINFIYKTLVNKKTGDNTLIEILNYAGTVVDQKRTISYVDPDYTEEKIVSGP